MTPDDPLLAECAKAIPNWVDVTSGQCVEIARAVLAIARPRIEAEAYEKATKVCELPAFGVDTLIDGTGVPWSRSPNGHECAKRIRNLPTGVRP